MFEMLIPKYTLDCDVEGDQVSEINTVLIVCDNTMNVSLVRK